jgi:LPXTG-motif cell wall-anchored protein
MNIKLSEIKIPTMVGLFVAIIGLVSGIWLVQEQVRKSIQAAGEETPHNVQISNISDTGFTVTWLTDTATSGYVQYGEGKTSLDMVVTDDRDQQKGMVDKYMTHLVTIKGLQPNTEYRYKLGSGKAMYNIDGDDYKTTTGKKIEPEPQAEVIYGQVTTSSGEPAEGALVYLNLPGGVQQATMVKQSGSWVLPLATIRNQSLDGYAVYDKNKTIIDLVFEMGMSGKSKVSLFANEGNPVKNVMLGRDYDYTTEEKTNTDASSSAILSKLGGSLAAPVVTDLNILTPQGGDNVSSDNPQIIGQAPAGTEVTIEIHSETMISGKVVADDTGRFAYNVPDGLSLGKHSLTVTALIDGVIKTVTREFTVRAADESFDPAFTATPEATLVPQPTLSPTPTVKIVQTEIPEVTLKPSATPSLVPTVKPSPTQMIPAPTPTESMPKSGGEDQTWLLLAVGTLIAGSGWWWYRKTE